MTPHFVPTSDDPRWKGRIKCAYCDARGWDQHAPPNPRWWGHKHGANCIRRPA